MANETIQMRISANLKHDAEALFASMGLGLSDAVRMFLQQSVNEGAIPFQPRAKRPNAETIAAMEELERGEGERFDNIEDLFASWRNL
ncbi:MAG: type II toxin-antitoxin system RelB/DinJ family antitoxin [Pseudomonadota bacterium]